MSEVSPEKDRRAIRIEMKSETGRRIGWIGASDFVGSSKCLTVARGESIMHSRRTELALVRLWEKCDYDSGEVPVRIDFTNGPSCIFEPSTSMSTR